MSIPTLIAMVMAVVSAIAFACCNHGLNPATAWVALLIGFIFGMIAWENISKKQTTASPKTFWDWFVITAFILASLRAFLWLIYEDGNAIKVLSPNNLGDLSLHLCFIRYLSSVTHWMPVSPLLIHEPLRYPLGSDLLNSLLLLVGVPIERSLVWVGLVGAVITGVALWRWGRAFGIAAFLFNGGLACVVLLHGLDPEMQVQWKNLFLAMFVTQRGFLYALPAGLFLMSAWREQFFAKNSEQLGNKPLPAWVQIILISAMPLFSPHAFLFIVAIMTSVMFFNTEARKKLIVIAVVAWPLALFSMHLISPGGTGKNFIAWHLGWMQEGNPYWFWFWNFGISLPLVAWLSVSLFFRKDEESKMARVFVWPAVVIFIACVLMRFAPWPWDNMKWMMWSWLTVFPFLWTIIIKPHSYWLRALLCFLLFGSGVFTLVDGLSGRHGYEIAKRTEVDTTRAVLRNVPADAVVAIAPEYNHPVLLLGHPVVAGYEGHLWSHGLDYHERFSKLHSIMMGEDGWEARAKALGVKAIYWSSREKNAFPSSKLPFACEQKLPMIYEVK